MVGKNGGKHKCVLERKSCFSNYTNIPQYFTQILRICLWDFNKNYMLHSSKIDNQKQSYSLFLRVCVCYSLIKTPILPTIKNAHYDGDSIV